MARAPVIVTVEMADKLKQVIVLFIVANFES